MRQSVPGAEYISPQQMHRIRERWSSDEDMATKEQKHGTQMKVGCCGKAPHLPNSTWMRREYSGTIPRHAGSELGTIDPRRVSIGIPQAVDLQGRHITLQIDDNACFREVVIRGACRLLAHFIETRLEPVHTSFKISNLSWRGLCDGEIPADRESCTAE